MSYMPKGPLLIVMLIFLGVEMTSASCVNVALLRPTKQVDSSFNGDSSRAVDGGTSNLWKDETCTSTVSVSKTWWVVDLLFSYDIHTIVIFNRRAFNTRLGGFSIYVSPINPLPIPASDQSFMGQLCLNVTEAPPKKGSSVFHCDLPVRGRYVYLWKPDNDCLSFCELQVLVDERQRNTKCTVSSGRKSLITPVYREIIERPTFALCMVICMSSPDRLPTLIQIDKELGMCECIQQTDLVDYPQFSWDQQFDLCQLDEMISLTDSCE